MIGIYERSLCQSYASAYRQGILLAKTDDEAVALLLAVLALEFYVIRMLAAGLVVLALLACG